MCNALNHPPGCTCGWGGDGHLGKRTDGNIYLNGLSLFDTKKITSYLNPNAKCPVCGESVFFYKSEAGGRVYFDELGPPWPKHPCTDNSEYNYHNPKPSNEYFIKVNVWQKNDWVPVLAKNMTHKSAYAFTLERIDSYLSVYLDIMIYGTYATELTKKDLIIFVKRKDNDCFTMAVYNVNDNLNFELDFSHAESKLNSFFYHQTKNTYSWP
ncbi:hypothetical protein [Phnomibacter sp. MR]|uniref:hypothetical protein n=1 Tax=Phnomibacter sp. MR TaxID=3042318 RepID=UPI003A7FAA69